MLSESIHIYHRQSLPSVKLALSFLVIW